MRLSPTEIDGILKVSRRLVPNGRVYLYGSRVNHQKRGGDIDLLIVVPEEPLGNTFEIKLNLLTSLHEEIGEQKIDLTLASDSQLKEDPFLLAIFPTCLELKG